MTAEKRYYWLKLYVNFFQQREIKKLRKIAGGDTYTIIYLKMLLLAVQQPDCIISYDVPKEQFCEELSIEIDENVENVKVTLAFLETNHLVECGEGDILLSKASEMVGSETESARRKRKQRMLPELTNGSIRLNDEFLKLPSGKKVYIDETLYGGNGMFVYDRAQGKCEKCGSEVDVNIYHVDGESNDANALKCLCRACLAEFSSVAEMGQRVDNKGTGGGQIPKLVGNCPPEIEIEIEKEKEINKEKPKRAHQPKEKKKPYGSYKNVMLTDTELEKLKTEHPDTYMEWIEQCSVYCDSNNKSYVNYLSAIRNWIRRSPDKEEYYKQQAKKHKPQKVVYPTRYYDFFEEAKSRKDNITPDGWSKAYIYFAAREINWNGNLDKERQLFFTLLAFLEKKNVVL